MAEWLAVVLLTLRLLVGVGGVPPLAERPLFVDSMTGEATYYARGVMQRVYLNRLSWRHVRPCRECLGMVALENWRHQGERIWLQRPGFPAEGPYLVVDSGRFLTPGRILEVDWQTMQRWNREARAAGRKWRWPMCDVTVLFTEHNGRGH
jgi:hypothetical protein